MLKHSGRQSVANLISVALSTHALRQLTFMHQEPIVDFLLTLRISTRVQQEANSGTSKYLLAQTIKVQYSKQTGHIFSMLLALRSVCAEDRPYFRPAC